MSFFPDLFKGVGNKGWELGRVAAGWAIFSTSGIAIYKIYAGQDLPLNDYATAMMTVFTGCALFIGSKDVARAYANSKAPSS